MALKTVLFDLDGTLLPMDQDEFVKAYFGRLAAKLAPHGYEPKKLIEAIWSGTMAMVKNTGEKTNEAVFWEDFTSRFGPEAMKDTPLFDDFYHNEFPGIQAVCGFNPQAAETVARLKAMGLELVLATNPIFPSIATENRIRWAGLAPEDFRHYTVYENSRYCKPNPAYYRDIAELLELEPESCLMVGNDVTEDMVAGTLGMKVFLLTDCLINKDDLDIDAYPHGSFPELWKYIESIA